MPAGKKLGVVLSVLAAGGSLALFFRKDASQFEVSHESASDNVFRQRVERRVATDTEWARKQAPAQRPAPARPAVRVVPTTASIPETSSGAPAAPTHHKTFHPVGALLPPVDGVAEDRDLEPAGNEAPMASDGTRRHTVTDGDTLTKLAVAYLGRADRYLEIFEANRGVLTSPDLLPIGASLKIPARATVSAQPPSVQVSPPPAD